MYGTIHDAARDAIYYRLSLAHDAAGKFHHYEVWRAKRGVSGFLAHVLDLLPGVSVDTAHAFCNMMRGQDDS